MVADYRPRGTRDEAVAYLARVGNALGEDVISFVDALSELENTLASKGFAATSYQRLDKARVSYTRQFSHRDQSRAAAQNAAAQPLPQPRNPEPAPKDQPVCFGPIPGRASPPPMGGAGPRPNTTLDAEQMREFLEWRRTREASGEPSTLKKRAFPWSNGLSVEDVESLHPNVAETRRLIRLYAKDLEGTRSSLLDLSNLSELPDPVWKSILKDEFVDSDKIHTACTTVSDSKKRSEELAEGVYIQTESDAPTKHITCDSD